MMMNELQGLRTFINQYSEHHYSAVPKNHLRKVARTNLAK